MARTARAVLLIGECNALLRGEGSYAAGRGVVPWRQLVLLVIAGGLVYGAAMGAYGARAWQAVYSASKVPLLLGCSTLVCLPSFYVINVLLGLRDDFSAACRGVFAAQATLAVVLASLAPVTLFFYASNGDYEQAKVWNGVMFFVGTVSGQVTLSHHYRALIAASPAHRVGRRVWIVLYVFVAIQLAWVLRPFLGAPDLPTTFFRADAWSNAYVAVFEVIARMLRGT